MAAPDPKEAATRLRKLITTPPSFATSVPASLTSPTDIITRVPELIKRMAEHKPLCHNMTNLVVQNFAANVALAMYVFQHLPITTTTVLSSALSGLHLYPFLSTTTLKTPITQNHRRLQLSPY